MSNYRRPKHTGATVFFTVNLSDRSSDLLVREVDILRSVVAKTRAERPFKINAWVVLPDHMHCIWTLPDGDTDFSMRWNVIKSRFSHAMKPAPRRNSHVARREKGIWQRRFWEHHIRDDADLAAYVKYCWINPVKHGWAATPADWPYSSYHRDNPLITAKP